MSLDVGQTFGESHGACPVPRPVPNATTAGRLRDSKPWAAAFRVESTLTASMRLDQFFGTVKRAVVGQHVAGQLLGTRALQLSSAIKRPAFICALARLISASVRVSTASLMTSTMTSIISGASGGVGAGVEAEETRVGVRRVKGVDRVAQPALFTNLLEQPRGHAAAENVGEHLKAEQRQVAIAAGLPGPASDAPARDRDARRGCRRLPNMAGCGFGEGSADEKLLEALVRLRSTI